MLLDRSLGPSLSTCRPQQALGRPHSIMNCRFIQTIHYLLLFIRLSDALLSSTGSNRVFRLNDSSNDSLQQSTHHDNKLKWKKKQYLLLKDVSNSIKKGDTQAIKNAEMAVRKMHHWQEQNPELDLVQAYNLWTHACARSGEGKKAEEVLREMQYRGLQPNVRTYTSVMDAYAQQAKRDADAPSQAERILYELIDLTEQRELRHIDTDSENWKLTSVTCDVVLNAWAQQGTWDGACRAQEILDRLEMMSATGAKTSSLRPSLHSYATVISAFAHSKGGLEAAQSAEALLNRIKSDKLKITPDTVTYNAVIHAWANSGNPQAGTKAVKLLSEVEKPDVVTYNTVLNAVGRSGHAHAAKKAEQILQQMIRAHEKEPESAPAPNTISYNCLLHALSKSMLDGAAKRARTLLHFMIHSGDDNNIYPDIYSFTSALDCVAKSKDSNKAAVARDLLDQLIQLYNETGKAALKPTQVPFNAVLNAAAFSALGTTDAEKKAALQIAVKTFSSMHNFAEPDMVSYGNLLKAIANLMPPSNSRTEMALQVFHKCRQSGLVGDLVWNEARRAIPSNALFQATGLKGTYKDMSVEDLPRDWTKRLNIRRRRAEQVKQKKPRTKKAVVTPIRRVPSISETSYQSNRDL